ncbi:ATP-binding protein [Nisaea nitritireducens]|uniref:ATP-binding protein n=1 Tax=Nisaea nitritireducens TaxID=568392 RepID=UPI001868B393|nr:ATP-binding protein [Nisaea nitritireducens]
MASRSLVNRHSGIAVVVILATASIAAMLFLGIQAASRFNAAETSWRQYNDQTRNVSGSLNALQRHLGYGGFIHNFKNFVLRRDPVYLERMKKSAFAALTEIAALKFVLPSAEEQSLLNDVQATIDDYLAKEKETIRLYQELSVNELDKLVRVDDNAALVALEKLQGLNEIRSFQQEKIAQASFNDAMSTLKQGSFVVVLILAGASGMIVLLIRASRINARLNASLAYIEQLYNESPNALVSVDSTGHIFRINRQTERLLGYSIDELSGRAIESLIPEEFEEDRRSLEGKLTFGAQNLQAEDGGMQMVARRSDGQDIQIHLRIRVVAGTNQTFFLLALLDITEIADLHKELHIARQNAETASEAKSRFLTSMSHEIRTPLNGILGMLQLIDKKAVAPDIAQKLSIAKESGLFLLTLINQVLDFARIEAGRITISKERFSLPAMMNAMESMFRIRAEMKGLGFRGSVIDESETFLYGDFDHIRQILFNLIGNAIKFTETGSVDLVARSQMLGDGKTCRISFEVSDTGPGIAIDDIDDIFEEFTQTDVGIRHGGGTGLGLNISKRIADAIGARLTVESEVGAGTTFRLSVDTEIARNQQVIDEIVKDADIPHLRVLVAEDNDINQMITQAMLERDGHAVTIAQDGEIALNLVRNAPEAYDVILMDVQMPNMDGVQATVSIRQFARNPEKLPIIGLTANAFQDQKDEYLSAGMQFVLTKPLEIADLRTALGRFTLHSHPERQTAITPPS